MLWKSVPGDVTNGPGVASRGPATDFLPKVKGTATGYNMPSPGHSGNQDEAVHPPLDSANCSEKDCLERAIGQYHHALQHWEFGDVRIPRKWSCHSVMWVTLGE